MEDLLTKYSMTDILLFIVFLAAAIKGVIEFIDWVKGKNKGASQKNLEEVDKERKISQDIVETRDMIQKVTATQEKMCGALDKMNDQINTLIESDQNDIKSFITREHHYFCYQKKWIDDYSLECCEKRYGCYQKEGGNSFIAGLMDELRQLPHLPPEEVDK